MTKKELKEIVTKRFIFGDDYENNKKLYVINLKIDKDLLKKDIASNYQGTNRIGDIESFSNYNNHRGIFNNDEILVGEDKVYLNCFSDRIIFESEAVRETAIDDKTIQSTTYKQIMSVDINKLDQVYITLISVANSSPVILIDSKPIYDLNSDSIPDIINTNKYIYASFDYDVNIDIKTIKSKKFKGPARSPRLLVEDIYTSSSIDKEKIEYDKYGNVTKYNNTWNKISKVMNYIEEDNAYVEDTMFDGHIIRRDVIMDGNRVYFYDIIEEELSSKFYEVPGNVIKYSEFNKLIKNNNSFVDEDGNDIISIVQDTYNIKYVFNGVKDMSILSNYKACGFDSPSTKVRLTEGWYIDNDQEIYYDQFGKILKYKSLIYGNKVPDKIYIRNKYGVPMLSNMEVKKDEEKK